MAFVAVTTKRGAVIHVNLDQIVFIEATDDGSSRIRFAVPGEKGLFSITVVESSDEIIGTYGQ